jgi:hypothetical protein
MVLEAMNNAISMCRITAVTFNEQLESLRESIKQQALELRKSNNYSVFDAYAIAKEDVLSVKIHSVDYETLQEQVDTLKAVLIIMLTDKGPKG